MSRHSRQGYDAVGEPPRQELDKLPTGVKFIFGMELCERFSYYGLRAVLALYLRQFWTARSYSEKQSRDDKVTALLHTWIVLCYTAPLLGGYISDAKWGKYKTILYLSIVYAIGNVVNACTAIPGFGGPGGSNQTLAGACVGLLLVALGTGGIKPCVAAFGGDQFDPSNPLLIVFFSLFYFSINLGSILGTLITPVLRENVECFGQDECYPLAFGVPSVLMLMALAFFILGAKYYYHVPPAGSMLAKVFGVLGLARRRESGSESHWVERAEKKGEDDTEGYDKETVRDVRDVLGVLYMLLPVPIFWTLFDQTASRWTLMATEMDGCLTGSDYERVNETIAGQASWKKSCSSFEILADQVQVLNSLFVLVLIPFFSKVVYRFFPMKPLTKMAIGMLLCAGAFGIASAVQFSVTNANIGVESVNGTLMPGKSFQYDHGCIEDDDYIVTVDDCMRNPDVCADCELCVHGCTSMLWQIPMYFVLTCGEIMVSITGLEFAYAEAPASMKSVCQAAWLLTVAIGNVVVIIVAGAQIFGGDKGVAYELLAYAGLMVLTVILFSWMASGYTYVSPSYTGRPDSTDSAAGGEDSKLLSTKPQEDGKLLGSSQKDSVAIPESDTPAA